MTTLFAMRGYSGAGKSTKAREVAKENNAVVVCRDNLRMMLLGSYWTGKTEDEDRVTVAELAQVEAFLLAGTSVVVDATHLNPVYLRRWAKVATRMGVDFQVVDVHTDIADCRRNDHARMLDGGRYVGDKVIDKQAKRWPEHKWPTITAEKFNVVPAEPIFGLPPAIICDIDGTLAHIPEGGRSPYDYTRVMDDELDPVIHTMLRDYKIASDRIGTVILVSGRDDTCRKQTLAWLNHHGVTFDKLYMRPAERMDSRGNKAPDYIVKYELFDKHIRGNYNIEYVLDDRNQVVSMWRKLGLKCLQVQEGNF